MAEKPIENARSRGGGREAPTGEADGGGERPPPPFGSPICLQRRHAARSEGPKQTERINVVCGGPGVRRQVSAGLKVECCQATLPPVARQGRVALPQARVRRVRSARSSGQRNAQAKPSSPRLRTSEIEPSIRVAPKVHPLFSNPNMHTRIFSKAVCEVSLARGDAVFLCGEQARALNFVTNHGMVQYQIAHCEVSENHEARLT